MPKPTERRQRWANRPELGLVQASKTVSLVIPEHPKGLLRTTIERWETYWRSPVAQVAVQSGGVDLSGLERWILNLDEWTRAMRALRRKRIVLGSQGQPVLNPLASYLASREAAIKEAEDKYGMTPMSRLRLGIAVGQAKLTAAELNRALEEADDHDDAADELADEWEDA